MALIGIKLEEIIMKPLEIPKSSAFGITCACLHLPKDASDLIIEGNLVLSGKIESYSDSIFSERVDIDKFIGIDCQLDILKVKQEIYTELIIKDNAIGIMQYSPSTEYEGKKINKSLWLTFFLLDDQKKGLDKSLEKVFLKKECRASLLVTPMPLSWLDKGETIPNLGDPFVGCDMLINGEKSILLYSLSLSLKFTI